MFSFRKVKNIVFSHIKGSNFELVGDDSNIKKDTDLNAFFNLRQSGDTLTITSKSDEELKLAGYNAEGNSPLLVGKFKSEKKINTFFNINQKNIESITFQNCNLQIRSSGKDLYSPKIITKKSTLNIKRYFKDELNLELSESKVYMTNSLFVKRLYLNASKGSRVLVDEAFIVDAYIYVDSCQLHGCSNVRFYRGAFCNNATIGLSYSAKLLINVIQKLTYCMYKQNSLILNGEPDVNNYANFQIGGITSSLHSVYPSSAPVRGKGQSQDFNQINVRDLSDEEIESAYVFSILKQEIRYPVSLDVHFKEMNELRDAFKEEKKLLAKEKEQDPNIEIDPKIMKILEKIAKEELEEELKNEKEIDSELFILELLESENPTDVIDSENREYVIESMKYIMDKKVKLTEKQLKNKDKLCQLFDIKYYGKSVIF